MHLIIMVNIICIMKTFKIIKIIYIVNKNIYINN